jgi:hypothetical protein
MSAIAPDLRAGYCKITVRCSADLLSDFKGGAPDGAPDTSVGRVDRHHANGHHPDRLGHHPRLDGGPERLVPAGHHDRHGLQHRGARPRHTGISNPGTVTPLAAPATGVRMLLIPRGAINSSGVVTVTARR